MPAIVTNKFRIHNSEQFSESFSESGANVYYMLLGRPQAFATSTRGDSRTDNEGSDSSPLTPADAIETEFFTFDDSTIHLEGEESIEGRMVFFKFPSENFLRI